MKKNNTLKRLLVSLFAAALFFSFNGCLEVHVVPEMDGPLDVVINGNVDSKTVDETVALSASVTQTEIEADFQWFVNGDYCSGGASFVFDDGWDSGFYRIDVKAQSSDGSRAGSAAVNIDVF